MFTILVEDRAAREIQDAIDYYNKKQFGLGKRFETVVNNEFQAIAKNPFYEVRYSNIRCKPVKYFPFLIHFLAVEQDKLVYIFAVINTRRNPKTHWLKTK